MAEEYENTEQEQVPVEKSAQEAAATEPVAGEEAAQEAPEAVRTRASVVEAEEGPEEEPEEAEAVDDSREGKVPSPAVDAAEAVRQVALKIADAATRIGAATAHLLASAGMKVYAGSRRGTIDEPQEGIVPVKLDVNDAAVIEAVVADILSREGRLDAVICNAGNGIYGPVEGTLEEEARNQFETTFYGSLIANWICVPINSKLKENNDIEISVKSIMIEGILSIQAGENPHVIEEKLKTFLAPAARDSVSTEQEGG